MCIRDRLWGVAECRIAGKLSAAEMDTLKEYIAGQASDEMCIRDRGIAQLGERLNGIQEVSGSIPLISTNNRP